MDKKQENRLIYVLNLKDSRDRWNKLKKIHPYVKRFNAIDSRKNPFIYKDYGFSLYPAGRFYTDYFSTSKGAIGCYISHWKIWQEIINSNVEYGIVFEDDVIVEDMFSVIKSNIKIDADFIQLNKRSLNDIKRRFIGMESYIITRKGAIKLLKYIDNCNHLPNVAYDVYGLDSVCLFDKFRCIYVPIDKLIGYLGNEEIETSKRLDIHINPLVGLNESSYESTITTNTKACWKMTKVEKEKFRNSEQYKWWER